MIEVELRGELTEEGRISLENVLAREGTQHRRLRRLLLDYSTFIEGQAVVGRTTDIRLRVTNDVGEIVVKHGAFGGAARREVAISFTGDQFQAAVEILSEMGLKKAMACIRDIERFSVAEIEYSIVNVPKYGAFFEIETLVEDPKTARKKAEDLREQCDNLGLSVFSTDSKAFEHYVEKLNSEATFANWVFEFGTGGDRLEKAIRWVQEGF